MSSQDKEVQMLLEQVFTIRKAYELVAKNTGEKFNLFSILGMESLEVKTHSRFLAELLNNKGSHLRGSSFLELFIDYCNQKIENLNDDQNNKINNINLKGINANVAVEYYIGKKEEGTPESNFEDSKGGRIDILIWDNQNALIIENKIYAGEQDKQLIRYSNFGSSKGFDNHVIVYLTLDGSMSNSHKISDTDKILCLSYKEDIINWLELCKREVVDYPSIREGINQYITLLKKITHQTTNLNLSMEVQNIILNNIESSQLIYDNFDKAIYKITSEVRNKVIEGLKTRIDNRFEISEQYIMNNKSAFAPIFISSNFLPKDVKFAIEGFNYFMTGHKNGALYYGVWSKDGNFAELDNRYHFDQVHFGWWREILTFHDKDGKEICFANSDFLKRLNTDSLFVENLIELIVNQFLSYLSERKELYS